jgi:hypothetical protein
MSLAPVAGFPSACSGERYCGVPTTCPVWVSAAAFAARAMPKSVIFTVRPGVTSRFAGFTSRCTMPRSCAAASASAACATRSQAVSAGIRSPPRSSADSGSPRTSSITRKARPVPWSSWVAGSSPKSKTDATFGWCRAAALRASVSNRLRNVGSPAYSLLSTFTATSRPSTVSVARHTSPMPPVAMRLSNR